MAKVECELITQDAIDVDVTQNVLCVEIGSSTGTLWGEINGNIENQADLIDYIEQHADNSGIPTLTIPDSTAEQALAPNVLYFFETRTSTLTLTLDTPIVGIANEYHFFIVCGTTAPTINFPSGIKWNGENAPEIAADKTYEISILNNVAAYFEV